ALLWSGEGIADPGYMQHLIDGTTPPKQSSDVIGFGASSPQRCYSWEAFVHIPLRIAQRLAEERQFSDAIKWLHLVLDPAKANGYASLTNNPSGQLPSDWQAEWEAWHPRPLFFALGYTNPQVKNALWADNPFDTHAIAESDPVRYRMAIVKQYVETLTAWGDHLFGLDTHETIAEAMLLYHYALDFLGPRPLAFETTSSRNAAQTIESLLGSLFQDPVSGLELPRIKMENMLAVGSARSPGIRFSPKAADEHGQRGAANGAATIGFFCMPKNDAHLRLWDILEDRLFKIRNCMNIDGIVRKLPLFEPGIDPGALIAAIAGGASLESLQSTQYVSPHVRFRTMLGMARNVAQHAQRLADALQQALQNQDAEELVRLRQVHEVQIAELTDDVRRLQVDSARVNRSAREESKAVVEERLQHYEGLKETKLIPDEVAEQTANETAERYYGKAAGNAAAGAIAAMVPQLSFGTEVSTSLGGLNLAGIWNLQAANSRATAEQFTRLASNFARLAGQQRREEDWDLQIALAKQELAQIDTELETLDKQIEIAERELSNHRVQVDQARTIDRILKSRYTSDELFDWMASELAQLHSSAYQLALDTARKAEICFRRELGLLTSNEVGSTHWNSSRKGLVAAEKLLHDLDKMELRYVELHGRELEITKHVSLRRLDPQALLQLQQTGSCSFHIPGVRTGDGGQGDGHTLDATQPVAREVEVVEHFGDVERAAAGLLQLQKRLWVEAP
ncbi:MAG: hypothetical protein AAF211_26015, partial [Myxococcota bacterium]